MKGEVLGTSMIQRLKTRFLLFNYSLEFATSRIDRDGDEEVVKARQHLNAMYVNMAEATGDEEEARRHLGWQENLSRTKWCGAGTDIYNTVCPGTTGGDTEADYACHRHDHGKKANNIMWGFAVRLGCDIDRGLAVRTSNWAAQAVFGNEGLARMWGCHDLGYYEGYKWEKKWWGGWWYWGRYHGEHVHYGKSRLSSYSHSYGWKAQSRCKSQSPWCTGCM